MGRIRNRLRVLEGGNGECSTRGWGPDMEIEVTWHDGWNAAGTEPEEPELPEPAYCSVCGMPDVVIIRWPEQTKMTPEERREHEGAMRRLREGDLSE
jgi:hypothetical protein